LTAVKEFRYSAILRTVGGVDEVAATLLIADAAAFTESMRAILLGKHVRCTHVASAFA
jgi:hypothetical protein